MAIDRIRKRSNAPEPPAGSFITSTGTYKDPVIGPNGQPVEPEIDLSNLPDNLPDIDLSNLPDDRPEDRPIDLSNLPDDNAIDLSNLPDDPQTDIIGELSARMGRTGPGPELQMQPLQQGFSAPLPVKNTIPPTLIELQDAAHQRGEQGPYENPATYERSSNYPPADMTGGAPTLDLMLAGQVAKDVGVPVVKGAMSIAKNIVKTVGKKSGLEEFIATAKAAKAAKAAEASKPPLMLNAPPATASRMKAPLAEDMGLEGPLETAEQMTKKFMGTDVIKLPPSSEVAKMEVYVKGVQKGLPAKGIPDTPIYGVKGGTPEEKLKWFNDADPGSVTLAQIEKAGLSVPQAPVAPKPAGMKIQFNKRQSGEIQKAIGKSKDDVLDEAVGVKPMEEGPLPQTPGVEQVDELPPPSPIGPELPIDTVVTKTTYSKLPAGAEERLKQFSETTTPKFKAQNPLTQGSEIFKRADSTPTWRDAAKAENVGMSRSLNVKEGLDKLGIRPDTVESTALFHYIEHPNKGQAIQDLIRTSGEETARKIVTAERYVRKEMDKVLPKVNEVRARNGLAPIMRMEDYITHMNESSILTRLNRLDLVGTPEGADLAKGIDAAANELRRSKPNIYNKLEDVIFPYVKRKNEEYATDAAQSFQHYMDNAYRYIETQPHVNEIIEMAKIAEKTNPELASVLRDRANHMAGGRSPIDKAVDLVIHPEIVRFFEQLQRNSVGNVITFNPSVPLTQLQGMASTIGKYPAVDVIKAAQNSFFDRQLQEYALLNSEVLTTRALQAAETPLTSGTFATAWSKINAWFDYKVAEIAWMSSFKKAVKTMPLNKALEEADLWAAATQGHKARVSVPPLQQSQVVQSIAPLMGQQVAAARSVLKTAIEGKGLTGKALTTAKMAAWLAAVSAIKGVALNRKDTPFSLGDFIPYGPVLERGLGGPALSSLVKIAGAKTGEDRTRQAMRAGFLMQNKIPGGATVGRVVENLLMGPVKKGKKK